MSTTDTYWLLDGQWRKPGRPLRGRDAFKQPYPSDSLWNMPIGQDADLVPLGFTYTPDGPFANGRIAVAEENILCLDPDAPLAFIMETNAAWNGSLTRCGSRTGEVLEGNGTVSPMPMLPIPPGFVTVPYIGKTPNMSGALLYRDGSDVKIFETQPMHICSDGVCVSQFVNISWVGDSIYTGGMVDTGGAGSPFGGAKGGSHGGSFMTAFGGTIRLGELVPGGSINHVMKLTMDTAMYCSQAGGFGHVWPALQPDAAWEDEYGTDNPSVPDEAKMGMLLTIPEDFDIDALVTEPSKIMARAMRDYGAYLCDGDAHASIPHYTAWQVEASNEGFFVNEFKEAWGFEFFHRRADHGAPPPIQLQFRTDVAAIMVATCIVADNSPTNIGGAGARRAPMAPELVLPT